jgi:chaperonin cofactor prefoldin
MKRDVQVGYRVVSLRQVGVVPLEDTVRRLCESHERLEDKVDALANKFEQFEERFTRLEAKIDQLLARNK